MRGATGPHARTAGLLPVIALVTVLGCAPVEAEVPDWRTDPAEPYPFTTPVPPLAPTVIDGIYDRDPTDPYAGAWAECRRCPPYFVDRGRTVLTLDRGRWLNLHQQPRQATSGHFLVDGNRVVLLNDPLCPTDRGEYRFGLRDDVLTFDAIEDPCAFGERERDLTTRPWQRLGDAPRERAGPGANGDPGTTPRDFRSQ